MKDENKTKVQLISELMELRQRITKLEALETEYKKGKESLGESQKRYRTFFEDSPISLWEEDYSEVKKLFDTLRESGVNDSRAYFEHHGMGMGGRAKLSY